MTIKSNEERKQYFSKAQKYSDELVQYALAQNILKMINFFEETTSINRKDVHGNISITTIPFSSLEEQDAVFLTQMLEQVLYENKKQPKLSLDGFVLMLSVYINNGKDKTIPQTVYELYEYDKLSIEKVIKPFLD